MNFWRKDITAENAETRADVIIQKKRRKQDPKAKGLGAVSIGRKATRAIHQRGEDRHFLEGASAKATIGNAERDVQLLNLSSNGVMIKSEHEIAIGQRIKIEFDECAPITAEARWIRKNKIGLEFVAETVIIADAGVQDFIIKTIARQNELSGHPLDLKLGAEQRISDKRHELIWLAKIRHEGDNTTVRVRNISAKGAMISLAREAVLPRGSSVKLSLEKIGVFPAKVRWSTDRQVGIEFETPFDVSELVNEPWVELAPPDDAKGLGSAGGREGYEDEPDSLRVKLGNVRNPHQPPDMHYQKLTLEELYATLYPSGRPTFRDEGKESESSAIPNDGA